MGGMYDYFSPFCDCRRWQNYHSHPPRWLFYHTIKTTTDSKTFTHVSELSQFVQNMRFSIHMLHTFIHVDDKSRVCLTEAPGVKHSNYINASFIDVRI